MEIKFKETMTALHEYFTELKDLKNAGLDLIKFDAHKTLYNIVIKNLIDTYGFDEAGAMVQYAYDGKVSEEELNNLFAVVCPEPDDKYSEPENTDVPSETGENSSNYFVNNKAVSKKVFDEAIRAFNEDMRTMNKRIDEMSDSWLLRNIFS